MRPSFDRAFRRLTGAARIYQEAPRDPERLPELTGARSQLDDARADMRSEGVRYVAPPENPDFVEPGRGTDGRSVAGKVAAVVFAIIMIAVLVAVMRFIDRGTQTPLTFGEVSSSTLAVDDAGTCRWTLETELRNHVDRDVEVTRVWLRTSSGTGVWVDEVFTVPAGETVATTMRFALAGQGCPASLADISSGRIRFNDSFTTDLDLSDR